MQTQLEIASEDIAPSKEIRALVEEKAAALDRVHDGITSCHAQIRAPRRSRQGAPVFEVTLEVRVPGKDLVVREDGGARSGDAPLSGVLSDASATMARRLGDRTAQIRGDVPGDDDPLQGLVAEIRHDEDFGRIIAADGRLVYFHRNSVVDGTFEDLRPRDPVDLHVQTGESGTGPQASAVRRIGRTASDPTRKPSRR